VRRSSRDSYASRVRKASCARLPGSSISPANVKSSRSSRRSAIRLRAGVLVAGGAALTLATALLLPLMNGSAPLGGTVAALCVFMAAYTIANVVVYTVNMDYSRPGTGGTDFTVLSSFGLICSFVAASLGLAAADRLGYPAVAVGSVVLVLGGVALGVRHQRRHRKPDHGATADAADPILVA
jgi:predicted MFS family arabinose efflux permease